MKKPQHGGRREGAGRKPLTDDSPSVVLSARVTPAQRNKFQALGGSAWLRERIDRAKGPAT